MRTAIDTNILSAILRPEPNAAELSETLVSARAGGSLVICGAVYAEAMAGPHVGETIVEDFLADTNVVVDFLLSEAVWRLAASRFRAYAERRRRPEKNFERRLLADYIIGAHAVIAADQLMTMDRRLYERDFPELKLI
jgi:predicted nucleic acid-binding protein